MERGRVTARISTVDDADRLRALRLAALADSPDSFCSSLADALGRPSAFWREQVSGTIGGTPACTVLAFGDDEPIGMAVATTAGDHAKLIQVWVAPEWRGHHALDAMLAVMNPWVGAQPLVAEVLLGNGRALNAFTERGFAIHEETADRFVLRRDPFIQRLPTRRITRVAWIGLGMLAVTVGTIGIVVPGLPSTGFYIAAAWCFSKSSPRLEAWLLGLPVAGRLIADYRAGLGMPRSAKITACLMITIAVTISAFIVEQAWVSLAIVITGVIGILWISFGVPGRSSTPDSSHA